jgi:hypothetical protein
MYRQGLETQRTIHTGINFLDITDDNPLFSLAA